MPSCRLIRCLSLLAATGAAATQAGLCAESIRPTLELTAVRLEVTWVADIDELARAIERYEPRAKRPPPSSGLGFAYRRNDGTTAFSVLGKRDGEWVCLVFALRPRQVDGAPTLHLGHEVLHCLFGEYHLP